MMKKLIIVILAFSAAVSVQAQDISTLVRQRAAKKPDTKQVLQQRNMQLMNSIDSLQLIIDSLRNAEPVVVEEPAKEETREQPVLWQDQDEALQDSLLHLWYNTSKPVDFESVNEYDMDSAHFTSDVSDEEMIRRLKAMNASITLPFNETVKNYMVLYSERIKHKTEHALGLSAYYFPIIEEAFARYGLPLELKYMAIIESLLNPTATSRAGARGMWQFMYKTARGYGLYIDSYIDERLDVEKSVDAAARYLRDAYRVFGDWSLAISSYNCGSGNVIKAIRRAGGSSNFWDVYEFLPRETRGYMPAFVGAMYAFTYYREYGLEPEDVGMPVQTDTFEVHKKLHFRQINEVAGIPMEDIEQLNPQYLQQILPGTPDQGCVLRLPYKWTPAFMAANPDSLYHHREKELFEDDIDLAGIASKDGKTPQQQRISYKVKSGDSLGKIASKNHTTVANLKKWNKLRSDSIRVGQVLYIYKTVYVNVPKSETPKKEDEKPVQPKPVAEPMAQPAAPAPARADSTAGAPAEAAKLPDVQIDTTATVAGANSDTSGVALPKWAEAAGKAQSAESVESTQSSEPSEQAAAEESKPEFITYVVKTGDTLFKIAKQYPGVLVSEIKLANGLSTDSIRPGQKLLIPNKQ